MEGSELNHYLHYVILYVDTIQYIRFMLSGKSKTDLIDFSIFYLLKSTLIFSTAVNI